MPRALTRWTSFALLFTLYLSGSALASPWSMFGGSSGRASYAFAERAGPPLSSAWSATSPADQGVWTSPIVTQGARPLVAYGSQKPEWVSGPTSKGNVHLRDLITGQPVGPAEGTNVDDGLGDGDTFGGGNKASVAFADSSAPGGPPGQLFVLHNDDGAGPGSDVAIAQIDEATGELVQDVAVPDTPHFAPGGATAAGQNGSDVSGSPVLQLDDAGNGVLVFRVGLPVYDATGQVRKIEKVHVVPLRNARSRAAVIDVANQRVTQDFQPTSRTSPTLVTLAEPGKRNRTATYIAMGTSEPGNSNYVKTFRMSDLKPGPESEALTGWGQTVAVPLTPAGLPAGAPGSGLSSAPYLVVATAAGGATRVYKLEPRGDRLRVVNSTTVAGYPAPALALSAAAGPGAPAGGTIVVTTESNLYVLDAQDLRLVATFSQTPLRKTCAPCNRGEASPAGPDIGFYSTTPVVAGNHIYVARDNGSQLVLDLATAQPVPASQFTQDPANAGSTFTRGQPAVAYGHAVFASAAGVFTYRMGTAAPDSSGSVGRRAVAGRGPLAYLRLPARMRLRTVRRRGVTVRLRLAPWTRAGTRTVRVRLYAVRSGKRARLLATVRRTVRRPARVRIAVLTRPAGRRMRPGRYRVDVTVGNGRYQFGPGYRRRLTIVR